MGNARNSDFPVGSRVIVAPDAEHWSAGMVGEVVAVDGDERQVRFGDLTGRGYGLLDTWDLASAEPCVIERVHGEDWCTTHDTATPCVVGRELRGES